MAKTALVELEGVSPLMQSRFHAEPKLNKELADAYEQRTWMHKMHVDEDGFVYIPGIAFKRSLEEIAKYLGMQVPGKGKATYTKHFEAGVVILGDAILNVKAEDVEPETIFVNADGVRGSGKRVMKTFPKVKSGWKARLEIGIFDDLLTDDVVKHHLIQAGNLIGVGSFRVRNGGMCGRFRVKSFTWNEVE